MRILRRTLVRICLLATITASFIVLFFAQRNKQKPLNAPAKLETNRKFPPTPACIIPSILPDPSWIPKSFKSFSCSRYPKNRVTIADGHIITPVQSSNITCGYAPIVSFNDFNIYVSETYIPLPFGRSPCQEDIFAVKCENLDKNHVVFKKFMRCIFRKSYVTDRVKFVTENRQPPTLFEERLNILIFTLDSVSRVAWLEQMPLTTAFLSETLGGVIFDGHNINGDATTPQMLAAMTGFYEEELHEARRGFESAWPIDDFPFIWRQLTEQAGYVTLWDEDLAGFGTFHLRLMGFNRQPVDYYGRRFQLALEERSEFNGCLGSQPAFSEMTSLYRQLFSAYPDPVRKFAWVFSSWFTHSGPFSGSQKAFKIDALLFEELQLLHRLGHLNESALILMADHGSRYNKDRATFRGKIAERLPFLSMVFPKWFQVKYHRQMENLRKSSKGLTTHFDLHATLLDIGGIGPLIGTPKRGLSLFSEIPSNRTCADAEIWPHWCTCLLGDDAATKLSLSDPVILAALRYFGEFVNSKLLAKLLNVKCHRLTADRPFSAKRLTLNKEVVGFVRTTDDRGVEPLINKTAEFNEEFLQISFRTSPGNGEWEVTFLHNKGDNSFQLDLEQISRTNLYGRAPKCIQDQYPHLRQFCFCIV